MAIYAYLFDTGGQDRQVKLDAPTVAAVGDAQLLWVDVSGEDAAEFQKVADLLDYPLALRRTLRDRDGNRIVADRPRLDLYGTCFHLNMDALQDRKHGEPGEEEAQGKVGSAFRKVTVDFVVFANVVVTSHERAVAFLDNFDMRIKGDTHMGGLDGPAFLGAILNWHVTSYFRVLETLEAEVDSIDDAAFRLRSDRNLLDEMVRARRRVALVRRTILPHREVYGTLARMNFASFVTEDSSEALRLVYERLERAIEATDNARDLVLGSFDIFTTQTTLRTNEVVKVLTLVSSILLPAGVLANLSVLFIRTPVYDGGRPAFWELISLILGVGVIGLYVARRRRWL